MQTVQIPDLPDDLEPGMRDHMAGQIAIQTVLTVLGVPDREGDATVVGTDELLRSLAMGLAMMIAGDSRNPTSQAVRNDAEKWGKIIVNYAKILHDGNDNVAADLMENMRLQQHRIATN